MVHRDLKPADVLLKMKWNHRRNITEGSDGRVKIWAATPLTAAEERMLQNLRRK